MALLARHLRLPARVVMGFVPQEPPSGGPLPVTGADARVWVEVDFGELGWVSRPDPRTRQDAGREGTPAAGRPAAPGVAPLPDPPREPPAPPLDSAEDDRDRDDEASRAWVVVVLWVAAGVGVLLLAVLPLALVAWAKRRRRRRRLASARPADRVSGAWDEVVDHAIDAGFPRPVVATRRETAGVLADHYPVAGSVAVADRVDRSVFGAADPPPEEVDDVWGEVDRLRAELGAGLAGTGRLRARYSTRSLRGRRPAGRVGRPLRRGGLRRSGQRRSRDRENAADETQEGSGDDRGAVDGGRAARPSLARRGRAAPRVAPGAAGGGAAGGAGGPARRPPGGCADGWTARCRAVPAAVAVHADGVVAAALRTPDGWTRQQLGRVAGVRLVLDALPAAHDPAPDPVARPLQVGMVPAESLVWRVPAGETASAPAASGSPSCPTRSPTRSPTRGPTRGRMSGRRIPRRG